MSSTSCFVSSFIIFSGHKEIDCAEKGDMCVDLHKGIMQNIGDTISMEMEKKSRVNIDCFSPERDDAPKKSLLNLSATKE